MTSAPFRLQETTVAAIHSAYLAKEITCRQLTEWYLKRIDAYDLNGRRLWQLSRRVDQRRSH